MTINELVRTLLNFRNYYYFAISAKFITSEHAVTISSKHLRLNSQTPPHSFFFTKTQLVAAGSVDYLSVSPHKQCCFESLKAIFFEVILSIINYYHLRLTHQNLHKNYFKYPCLLTIQVSPSNLCMEC